MMTREKTSLRTTAMASKATAMVMATTVARESMPSMKLTALMTPTIQTTETTLARRPRLMRAAPKETKSKRKPKARRMTGVAGGRGGGAVAGWGARGGAGGGARGARR